MNGQRRRQTVRLIDWHSGIQPFSLTHISACLLGQLQLHMTTAHRTAMGMGRLTPRPRPVLVPCKHCRSASIWRCSAASATCVQDCPSVTGVRMKVVVTCVARHGMTSQVLWLTTVITNDKPSNRLAMVNQWTTTNRQTALSYVAWHLAGLRGRQEPTSTIRRSRSRSRSHHRPVISISVSVSARQPSEQTD
jgi:hypothetical protein